LKNAPKSHGYGSIVDLCLPLQSQEKNKKQPVDFQRIHVTIKVSINTRGGAHCVQDHPV